MMMIYNMSKHDIQHAMTCSGIFHEELAKSVHTESMNLPLSEVTIAKALQQTPRNYSPLMIGKWHLGETAGPISHGFDQSLGFNLLSRYLPWGSRDGVEFRLPDQLDELIWASARYQVSRNGEKKQFAPKGYLTDYFAEEAASAIALNRNNPFFLYLSLTAPHTPYQALRSDYDQLGHITDELTRVYAAMILSVDRAVGTVLESLRENALIEDTLIIFTNDNGAPSE
jgi:arylsulfatase A-like enzyme